MKKFISTTLTLTFIFALTACSEMPVTSDISSDNTFVYTKETFDEKYEAIIYTDIGEFEFENIKHINTKEILCEASEEFEKTELKTIDFDGQTYNVKPAFFSDSYHEYPYDHIAKRYHITDENSNIDNFFIDEFGDIIRIEFDSSKNSANKISEEEQLTIATEYAKKFVDTGVYKYDYMHKKNASGNTYVFSKFSGDCRTNESLAITFDYNYDTIAFIKHLYKDRFDNNTAEKFENIPALYNYGKQLLTDTFKNTNIEITGYDEQATISGYKNQDVLLIMCSIKLDTTTSSDSHMYSYGYGGIIILPK